MQKAYRWIFVSVLFLQTCGATTIVIVVSASGDYVVIAADSRGTYTIEKHEPNDRTCKLVAFNDTLFYNSGNMTITKLPGLGPPWDSRRAAREVYAASQDHDAQALAKAWGERAMKWYSGLHRVDLEKASVAFKGVLVIGGFVNLDSKRSMSPFSETISYNAEGHYLYLKENNPPNGMIVVAGYGQDLAKEFKDRQTLRAAKAWGTLTVRNIGEDLSYDTAFVRRAIQFIMDNDEIDIIDTLAESEILTPESDMEKQVASLKLYTSALPYECESLDEMQARLETIVGNIAICIKSTNWFVLSTWDSVLQWYA